MSLKLVQTIEVRVFEYEVRPEKQCCLICVELVFSLTANS